MDALTQDLRYALRMLARAPLFTTAAVASLAIGIGANTAIFSVLRTAVLTALPVHAPEELVRVLTDRQTSMNQTLSYQLLEMLRESGTLDDVFGHAERPLAVRAGDAAEQLDGAAVTGNFFSALGLEPVAGRFFAPEEDVAGDPHNVVVVSHDFWMLQLGGSRAVIGRSIHLNGTPFTVIGVAPHDFDGMVPGRPHSFWIPISAFAALEGVPWLERPGVSWIAVFARVGRDESMAVAQARLASLDGRMRDASFIAEGEANVLVPAPRGITYGVEELQQPFVYMLAAVGLVLLIACANVASLLLARAAARRRELAVRIAIGGTQLRVARQLLTESFVLALIAGVAGVLLAFWLKDALAAWPTTLGIPVIEPVLDGGVLAFSAALSLSCGLLFGVAPALQASRADVAPALKDSPSGDGGRLRLRGVLVVAQVALSLILIVGATLLARTIGNLERVDVGYGTRNALLASIDLRSGGYDQERGLAVVDRVLERLRALPGVTGATLASNVTPSPGGTRFEGVPVESELAPDDGIEFDFTVVDETYFDVMDHDIVRGASFPGSDGVVINEHMARQYWPGGDALGSRIFPNGPAEPGWQIVGIARDGKYRSLREQARSSVWRAWGEEYDPFITLLVRSERDASLLTAGVRNVLRDIDPDIPLAEVRTLEHHISLAAGEERMAARVAIGFSIMALVLAAIGLYGVLAHFVTQRSREIGIRMALGARATDVLSLVAWRGIALVAAGLGVGLPAAFAAGRIVQSMVYGVSTADVVNYGVGALVLATAGGIAALLPALRAVRLDPIVALRQE